MNNSSIIQDQIDGEQDDKGFTLIEILIAIVWSASCRQSPSSASATSSARGARRATPRRLRQSGSAVYFTNFSKYPADFWP